MKSKIIWAVDPFADEKQLQRSALTAATALARGSVSSSTEIVPVFLMDPFPTAVPRGAMQYYIEEVTKSAVEQLREIVGEREVAGLAPLRTISSEVGSVQQKVDELVRYAHQAKAQLIVLSSRARRLASRLLLGSFAESLLLSSPIPVLVVNPEWKAQGPAYDRILFPTDFSDASRAAFRELLEVARQADSEVIVFHKVRYGIYDVVAHSSHTELGDFVSQGFERYIQHLRKTASEWKIEAESLGGRASVLLDYEVSGNVVDAILSAADLRNAKLIALAATSSALRTQLIGSVTRQVVHRAEVPVWVLRMPEYGRAGTGRDIAA